MPHEIDMTKALIISLREWWLDQPERRPVGQVTLLVGKFTCVEPALLRSAFARQKLNTFLNDAELVIQDSPFIAHCQGCAEDYSPDLGLRYSCPTCGAAMEEIRSGRELKILRVDWEVPVDIPRGEECYV